MEHQSFPLRKRVAVVLGIEESTAGEVVNDWNKHSDGIFTPHEVIGRPKSQPNGNISELLRTKMLNANKTAEKFQLLSFGSTYLNMDIHFPNGNFFGYCTFGLLLYITVNFNQLRVFGRL
jgi:hypothetical protein